MLGYEPIATVDQLIDMQASVAAAQVLPVRRDVAEAGK
jgi:hypothetical protein